MGIYFLRVERVEVLPQVSMGLASLRSLLCLWAVASPAKVYVPVVTPVTLGYAHPGDITLP